jgi:hypothetical protein
VSLSLSGPGRRDWNWKGEEADFFQAHVRDRGGKRSTVGRSAKLPGELNMAASSRPGRNRRPQTATTINHVGQGDLKGVKYTKIHINVLFILLGISFFTFRILKRKPV